MSDKKDNVIDCCLELINILLSSDTEAHNDGVIQHEHHLFDNVDKDRLNAVYNRLLELSD